MTAGAMRRAVDATIAALASDTRPADTATATLARAYADKIDGTNTEPDMEVFDAADGLDPLARYGPKLTIVLNELHKRAQDAAGPAKGASEPATAMSEPSGPVTLEDRLAKAREARRQREASGQ